MLRAASGRRGSARRVGGPPAVGRAGVLEWTSRPGPPRPPAAPRVGVGLHVAPGLVCARVVVVGQSVTGGGGARPERAQGRLSLPWTFTPLTPRRRLLAGEARAGGSASRCRPPEERRGPGRGGQGVWRPPAPNRPASGRGRRTGRVAEAGGKEGERGGRGGRKGVRGRSAGPRLQGETRVRPPRAPNLWCKGYSDSCAKAVSRRRPRFPLRGVSRTRRGNCKRRWGAGSPPSRPLGHEPPTGLGASLYAKRSLNFL